MKVLVIGAHVDDAECGAGGTIVGHIKAGHEVEWHSMISNGYAVPEGWDSSTLSNEFEQAMHVLGVKNHNLHDFSVDTLDRITTLRDTIYKFWHDFKPDIAYVPWRGCRHQDHRAVGDCVYQVSWRGRADVRAYVLPNDYDGFKPTIFSPLSHFEENKKFQALACFGIYEELGGIC
jgi:LmbE family N-acetylglucosaminyl deacetylase